MASASQISFRNLGRQSWASAPTPRGGTRGRHAGVVVPYGWLRRAAAIALASGAQRSVCASGCEEMGGNCGRDHPQSIQQPWTIPQSRRSRDSSLYTREPLGTGGYGLPRRFAPRNDSPDPLSFRGGPTGRRGNPSFLRWTGVRAAVPRAWPPPTKFPSEIWGVGQVVGPYGKPDQPPKPAGAQRSVRARVGEGWAGIGAKAIPKGGPPPRPPRQRLAKRKARKESLVKFSLCPMTSECSTAYWVRKSQQGPARVHVGTAITE